MRQTIESASDVDAYKFEVAVPVARVRVTVSDLPADYDLHVFDTGPGQLAESTASGLTPETVELTLVRGLYYAFVNSANGEADPGRPYTPTFQIMPLDGPRPGLVADSCGAPHRTFETACQLTSGQLVAAALSAQQPELYYRVEADESGSLLSAYSGDTPADFTFALFDSAGNQIENGPGAGSIFRRVETGAYVIRVSLAGAAAPEPFRADQSGDSAQCRPGSRP